jgi:hypothetical protein
MSLALWDVSVGRIAREARAAVQLLAVCASVTHKIAALMYHLGGLVLCPTKGPFSLVISPGIGGVDHLNEKSAFDLGG